MTEEHLRRYTELPALIYMLSERKITLLDPASWDDRNDSHYLNLYREKMKLKSVLALCFTQADETYHHWRVFAHGSGGVWVRFKRAAFVAAAKRQSGVKAEPVTYLTMGKIRDHQVAIRDLPFLKRYAFQHENEFRLVYESTSSSVSKLDIDLPLSCIERITLSPWIHPSLSAHVKRALRSINGCSKLEIVRSTLISNAEWKKLGEAAA